MALSSPDEPGDAPGYPNLRHIRLLEAAVRLQSISLGADAVHISQPAASQALAKLERIFGVKLLERQGNGICATPEGEIVNRRGQRALDHIREATQRISAKSRMARGLAYDRLESRATITHLRALQAFSETGSFTAAAGYLSQTEPSVQRAAREIERIGGVPLFEGSHRNIFLTPEGSLVAAKASLALREIDTAHEELREHAGLFDGRLLIGTLPLARTSIVPTAVVDAIAAYPRARVEILDGSYDTLTHLLSIGRIDMLIGALRVEELPKGLQQMPLFEDELSIVARADHPLVRVGRPTVEDLTAFPWVVARAGTPNRAIFDRLSESMRLNRGGEGYIETGSLVALRGILKESDYLTLLSKHQVSWELESGALAVVEFPVPDTARTIGLTTRKGWEETRLQKDFVAALRRSVGRTVDPKMIVAATKV